MLSPSLVPCARKGQSRKLVREGGVQRPNGCLDRAPEQRGCPLTGEPPEGKAPASPVPAGRLERAGTSRLVTRARQALLRGRVLSLTASGVHPFSPTAVRPAPAAPASRLPLGPHRTFERASARAPSDPQGSRGGLLGLGPSHSLGGRDRRRPSRGLSPETPSPALSGSSACARPPLSAPRPPWPTERHCFPDSGLVPGGRPLCDGTVMLQKRRWEGPPRGRAARPPGSPSPSSGFGAFPAPSSRSPPGEAREGSARPGWAPPLTGTLRRSLEGFHTVTAPCDAPDAQESRPLFHGEAHRCPPPLDWMPQSPHSSGRGQRQPEDPSPGSSPSACRAVRRCAGTLRCGDLPDDCPLVPGERLAAPLAWGTPTLVAYSFRFRVPGSAANVQTSAISYYPQTITSSCRRYLFFPPKSGVSFTPTSQFRCYVSLEIPDPYRDFMKFTDE